MYCQLKQICVVRNRQTFKTPPFLPPFLRLSFTFQSQLFYLLPWVAMGGWGVWSVYSDILSATPSFSHFCPTPMWALSTVCSSFRRLPATLTWALHGLQGNTCSATESFLISFSDLGVPSPGSHSIFSSLLL